MSRFLASALLSWALLAPGAELQAQAPEELGSELARIRQALDQIVELLRRQEQQQERSLILRRLEMKNARLLPIEAAIRSATDVRRNAEADIERIRAISGQFDRDLIDAEPGTPEAMSLEEQLRQVAAELERLEGEVFVETQRLQDLEVERNDLLAEIRELERRLD